MFCILCAIGFVPRTIPTASAMICTQINTDVSVGQTDVTLGGPVSVLQAYLRQAGYLAAGSSGHFGSGTLAAVKAFQSANGISSTGYVGLVGLALQVAFSVMLHYDVICFLGRFHISLQYCYLIALC